MTSTPVRGMCRFCGCSEFDPCPGGCAWTNGTGTLCTECAPAAEAEAAAWHLHRRRGRQYVQAFHFGFIVGWFGVRRSFGRNPYRDHTWSAVWLSGRLAGEFGGKTYQRETGRILNHPRPSVLHRRTAAAR